MIFSVAYKHFCQKAYQDIAASYFMFIFIIKNVFYSKPDLTVSYCKTSQLFFYQSGVFLNCLLNAVSSACDSVAAGQPQFIILDLLVLYPLNFFAFLIQLPDLNLSNFHSTSVFFNICLALKKAFCQVP
jgi:hypothetical protein